MLLSELGVCCQNPIKLVKNLSASSVTGYFNSNSGSIGTSAAVNNVTSKVILIGTQRILRTTDMLLFKSARDCKSGVPNSCSCVDALL